MKAIYFTAFIANTICILLFLFGGAFAQSEQKKQIPYCFEVYDYVYLLGDEENSEEAFDLRIWSFDFLLEQIDTLKHLPLTVSFEKNQAVYYFAEPCSVSMEGFSDFIANHNREFKDELMLVPSQNYNKQDYECDFTENMSSCPAEHNR